MKIVIAVTPDEGDQYEVTVNGRIIVLWERAHVKNSVSKLTEGLRLTDVYSLAFYAARTQGKFAGTQEEFEASVEVEMVADEAADPTSPAA